MYNLNFMSFVVGIAVGGAAVLILVCVVIQALGAAIMDGEKQCGH